MAPPAKGTKAYKLYLHRQKIRRQRCRAERQEMVLRKKAAPMLNEQRKKLEAEIITAKQRTNQLLRKNNELHNKSRELLEHNISLEQRLMQKEAALKEAQDELVQARQESHKQTKQLVQQRRIVQSWELWWDRIKSKADTCFLQRLRKMARRPPSSADASWGGGQ